jgi:hypothetical protein
VPALLAGDEPESMRERLADDGEPVSATAGRPRQVDHERRAAGARDTAGKEAVGRSPRRIGPNRLRDARNLTLEDRGGRLRRDVTGGDSGPAGREHQTHVVAELLDRRGDLAPLVRDDASRDLVALLREQLLQQCPALVRPLAASDAVRDGEDGGLQISSFVFSSRRTSLTTIEPSIAFAMS